MSNFTSADTDKNGKLSETEFMSACNQGGVTSRGMIGSGTQVNTVHDEVVRWEWATPRQKRSPYPMPGVRDIGIEVHQMLERDHCGFVYTRLRRRLCAPA